MTDEIKIQPKKMVDEKETVNSVKVGNVSNVSSSTLAVKSERPTFLSVLCVLTFIGSGLSLLGYLFTAVFSTLLGSLLDSIPSFLLPDIGITSGIIGLVAAAASLYGAIKMWKLEKIGFYLYTAAQVVMLVLSFGIFGFILTALFVVLYGLNLKHLK